jgi:hypothetical protein
MSTDYIALVRAYRGAPLKRVVLEVTPDALILASPTYFDLVRTARSKSTRWDRQSCFAWSDKEFERLSKIFASDYGTTDEAWSQMPLFQGQGLFQHVKPPPLKTPVLRELLEAYDLGGQGRTRRTE